jgi:alanine racemase
MHRREFLKSGAVIPAASLVQHEEKPRLVSSFDPWVEIHSGNLRHNVSAIRSRVENRPILAVIKNNGYGMGVANAARLLEPESAILGFAVVKLQEAASLRDAGIRKPILLLGPFDEKNLEEAVAREITPMVYTPIGDALDRIAARRQKPVGIHVCVDTGIGRVGVPHREAAALILDLASRGSVRIEGVMMTFAEDSAFDSEQKKRFMALTDSLASKGVALGRRHAASSFALFLSCTPIPFSTWCAPEWRSMASIPSRNSGARPPSTSAPRSRSRPGSCT